MVFAAAGALSLDAPPMSQVEGEENAHAAKRRVIPILLPQPFAILDGSG